jgi:hypothetical protein
MQIGIIQNWVPIVISHSSINFLIIYLIEFPHVLQPKKNHSDSENQFQKWLNYMIWERNGNVYISM